MTTSAVTVADNVLTIDVMHFVKHDGYTHRVGGLFDSIYQAFKSHNIQYLRFVAPEDEPIVVSAFDRLMTYIIDAYDLPPDRVTIEMVDHVPEWSTTRASLKIVPAKSWNQCQLLIKRDLCVLRPEARLFGAFFGRFTHQRLKMAHFLDTEMSKHSIVNFQPGVDWVRFELEPFGDSFQAELDWVQSRTNPVNDLPSQHNGCISAWQCLPLYHELFGQYEIEVVIETHTVDLGVFTEKTAKCLCAGKPFVLMGTPGQLSRLREMGFETYSDCWDESYDSCANTAERFDRIKNLLRLLAGKNQTELNATLDRARDIAGRNRDRYDAIIADYYKKFEKIDH